MLILSSGRIKVAVWVVQGKVISLARYFLGEGAFQAKLLAASYPDKGP